MLFCIVVWTVVNLLCKDLIVKPFGIAMMPFVATLGSLLGLALPGLFQMGVQGFREASFIAKLFPIIVVALICLFIGSIEQTIATAIVVSIFVGNTVAYIGQLIGEMKK